MFLKMRKETNRGFTLIEIAIVITLVTIFTSIFVISGNLKENKEQKAFQSAVDVFLASCREVQTNAMNSKKHNGAIYCGWGIHYVDDDSYAIYVESGNGGSCSVAGLWRFYQPASDFIVKEVELENSNLAQFDGVFPDIYFEAPNPNVYWDGTIIPIGSNEKSLNIELISDTSKFKEIHFNGAGNIWVE